VHDRSRAIVIKLDEEQMGATLLHEYTSPEKLICTSQGDAQLLPNANVFVGWGSQPYFSEFSREGELLLDARFLPECESYRASRFPWKGHPTEEPAVAVEQLTDEKMELYASWNGATEVESWEVLSGTRPGSVETVGSVPRDGFKTAMLVQSAAPYVAVRARDHTGGVLGTSAPVEL